MNHAMNVFLTEGNIEIYLSKLHKTWDARERDNLLRLILQEQAQMGMSREHLENGERRVAEGRERLSRQRQLVAGLAPDERAASPAEFLLDTLEQTQRLLEQHLTALRERRKAKSP